MKAAMRAMGGLARWGWMVAWDDATWLSKLRRVETSFSKLIPAFIQEGPDMEKSRRIFGVQENEKCIACCRKCAANIG